MLFKAKTLASCKLRSLDGEIGKVEESYFDDYYWTIRYLVANTGNWLTGRQVLISPYSLTAVKLEEKFITVELTKKQIEESPALDSYESVLHEFEKSCNLYYGWPMYWYGGSVWGDNPNIQRNREKTREISSDEKAWDYLLRKTSAVSGYSIEASDGYIGNVEDFFIDEETWTIRYLVIDTGNWWPEKKVLISTQWLDRVSWPLSRVMVNLSRDAIKNSPEYTEESLLNRDYETKLHEHYDFRGYWED